MKIAVVGRALFITAFQLGGITDVFTVEGGREHAREVLAEVKGREDIGLVIMEDIVFDLLSAKEKRSVEASTKPLFVIISLKGEEGAVEPIRVLVKKALGIELKS